MDARIFKLAGLGGPVPRGNVDSLLVATLSQLFQSQKGTCYLFASTLKVRMYRYDIVIKNIFSLVIVLLFCAQSYASSINGAAGSSMLVQGVSVVANGYALRVVTPPCVTERDPMSCVTMAMTAAQLAALASSLGGASRTKDASECVGTYCDSADNQGTAGAVPPVVRNNSMPNIPGLPRDPEQIARMAQEAAQQAALQGYAYSDTDGSVRGPDGKKITPQDLSSPAAMKAAGFSPDSIEKAMATNAKIQKYAEDLLKKYGNLAEADSGGGVARKEKSNGYGSAPSFDMKAYMNALNKKDENRGVAGLEKRLGADSIGVAQDNIFEMIHRRYQKENLSLKP